MEILKLTKTGQSDIPRKIITALKKGLVVACPTDTVYGFLTDAENAEATQKIFSVKRRPQTKPLGVFVPSIAAAKKIAVISKQQETFLRSKWPGKLTAVLPLREGIQFPSGVGTKHTIGIRVPNHPLLLKVLREFKRPVVQTSANISGQDPILDSAVLARVFARKKHKPDLLIDEGALPHSLPSAIIDLANPTNRVLRKAA